MCVCDWGFMGADCSMRMCPKGDDPLTIAQNYRTVNVTTSTNVWVEPHQRQRAAERDLHSFV